MLLPRTGNQFKTGFVFLLKKRPVFGLLRPHLLSGVNKIEVIFFNNKFKKARKDECLNNM